MVLSFLHRNYQTFGRRTHISQKLLENFLNRMQKFLYYNIKLRSKYDLELNAIANMDETLLYLNIPPCTTVQKIRFKKVNIRTQELENWRVTVILTVLASRQKLPPLFIFKAKEGNDTEKKLQKLISVKSRRVFVYWQENACNNQNIMLKLISKVWRKYSFLA